MTERRLSPADAAWLYSEWEKNNQTVSALMWLDREIDPDDYIAIVQERMVDKYPTFSQRIRTSRNPLMMPHWEDDPDFDIGNHVQVLHLPEPGTKEQLSELLSTQRGELLDRDRPLWKMYVIQGYNGGTTAVHARIQHSIADGWALVRVVLSLCDDTPEAIRPEPVDKKRRRKRDLVAKAASPAVDVVRSPLDAIQDTINMALHPRRFIEFGSEALDALETGAEGAKNALEFLFAPRPGKTILHGKVTGDKKIVWMEPAPLQPIKDIGRAVGATINDVLLAVLTNALRTYLVENDALTVDELFTYEPETSGALGFGFRCGFLGLLHMEIVRERLEREFDLSLIATAPSVEYEVETTAGELLSVHNPSSLPPPTSIEQISEPQLRMTILTPAEYVGTIMELCLSRRGEQLSMEYLSPERVEFTYRLPLAEVVIDFFDALKSRTQGYASLDYDAAGYLPADLVRVDIMLSGENVDAFSAIVHKERSYEYGRRTAEKLKELIPRQQFDVPIQAAIGGQVIARETVRAFRKDVTEKLYGGDITRKRKLLEKQKAGKKRMKSIGKVDIPPDTFIKALRLD